MTIIIQDEHKYLIFNAVFVVELKGITAILMILRYFSMSNQGFD